MNIPGPYSCPPSRTLSFCCLVLSVFLTGLQLAAQETKQIRPGRAAELNLRVTRNQKIVRIVQGIDARNVERMIRKLVSFGTRNTLSTQDDPNRGIGAARDWLYSEFLKAAENSGGRMTVEKQAYEQQKTARIPTPTVITNVVATLRGIQPRG